MDNLASTFFLTNIGIMSYNQIKNMKFFEKKEQKIFRCKERNEGSLLFHFKTNAYGAKNNHKYTIPLFSHTVRLKPKSVFTSH